MKIALFLLLTMLAVTARAQRSHAYWLAGAGGASGSGSTAASVQFGIGGEIGITRGVAAGIEAGAIAHPRFFGDSVFGTASANGFYHFRPARSAVFDPFVTTGYTLGFRRGTSNLWNLGGGMNWWFLPHLALRAEFRDYVSRSPSRVHFWGFRFGVSFTELIP